MPASKNRPSRNFPIFHLGIFVLILVSSLLAFGSPAYGGQSVARSSVHEAQDKLASPSPAVAYLQAPPGATPTPTPFQPLPPTAVFYPTNTPAVTATPLPVLATPTPTMPPIAQGPQSALPQPAKQVNILLLGSDKRPWDTLFRTDTMILATLNFEKGTVNLTSFPRDLYVTIPGWGMNRLNTAYEFGGFELLAKTFNQNFGVYPDHYVLINFHSFKGIIDSLGGLTVNVAEPVSDWWDGKWVTIPAGENEMDADTILWYVRSRKTTSDFARNRRQQEVLQALFDKMLSLNAIKRVPEFWGIYKENVTTDLSLKDAISYLPLATRLTDTSRIHQYYIGHEQVWDWLTPEGGMVLLPRPDAVKEVMRQALNSDG